MRARADSDTARVNHEKGESRVSTTLPESTPEQSPVDETGEARSRAGLIEPLLDNLPVWTVIAAAIAFLYLV